MLYLCLLSERAEANEQVLAAFESITRSTETRIYRMDLPAQVVPAPAWSARTMVERSGARTGLNYRRWLVPQGPMSMTAGRNMLLDLCLDEGAGQRDVVLLINDVMIQDGDALLRAVVPPLESGRAAMAGQGRRWVRPDLTLEDAIEAPTHIDGRCVALSPRLLATPLRFDAALPSEWADADFGLQAQGVNAPIVHVSLPVVMPRQAPSDAGRALFRSKWALPGT